MCVWKAARPWRAHRLIHRLFIITLPPAAAAAASSPPSAAAGMESLLTSGGVELEARWAAGQALWRDRDWSTRARCCPHHENITVLWSGLFVHTLHGHWTSGLGLKNWISFFWSSKEHAGTPRCKVLCLSSIRIRWATAVDDLLLT